MARGIRGAVKEDDLDPIGLLNTSGFPFQMRIAEEIRTRPGRHNWSVVAEEHPWRVPRQNGEDSGFIDIVAGFGAVMLAIECKRGAGATWLFLTDKTGHTARGETRVLCLDRQPGEPDVSGWAPLAMQPHSPVAAFCIVRGQVDKEPMLERTVAGLLHSTDALGAEMFLTFPHARHYRFMVPVIVTGAELLECSIDTGEVDIVSGKVAPDQAQCGPVSAIRFHKAFGTATYRADKPLPEVHDEMTRTVIVVNAGHFGKFLEEFDLQPPAFGDAWPNDKLRARANR